MKMKTQKRTFVVEVKSSRRPRSVKKPQSIWGSTDFNAIAREIDAPWFGPNADVSEVTQTTPELRAEIEPEISRAENSNGSGLTASIPSATAHGEVEAQLEASAAEQCDPLGPEERPRVMKITPAARKRKRTGTVEFPATSMVIATLRDNEDLATLELENQRLTAMWRHHLIEENRILRVMLRRFDD
ncbi:hypothetical protein [Rhizobium sp. RAF56]|uniref:hypothetical protein n=1 Tax=Rhizobium sp. RAF56 TaxID=3233062 RepID=UPI003F99F0E7